MENQSLPLKNHILQYGSLLGGISVVFGLMIYFLDMHYSQETAILYVSLAMTLGVLVLAMINYRKDNDGFMSLGEALKLGLGIALVSAAFGVAYQILLVTVIDPDTISKMMDVAEMKILDENPEIPREQLDQILAMQEKGGSPMWIAISGFAGSLILCFIFSLISGLILKRNRPE